MRIACITDDGKTISEHLGRAPMYVVLTVENGQIVQRETRSKLGHQHFQAADQPAAPGQHGRDADSHIKHVSMAAVIADCQALLCRGMGRGAYESMISQGITPVVTDEDDIEAAALAYAEGRLVDHPERLH